MSLKSTKDQTSKTAARTVTEGESSWCFRISPSQPAEFTERKWCIACFTAVSSCFQRLGVFSNTTLPYSELIRWVEGGTNTTRCYLSSTSTSSYHKHDFKTPCCRMTRLRYHGSLRAWKGWSGNFHRRPRVRARAGVEMICKWAPALYRPKRAWARGVGGSVHAFYIIIKCTYDSASWACFYRNDSPETL